VPKDATTLKHLPQLKAIKAQASLNQFFSRALMCLQFLAIVVDPGIRSRKARVKRLRRRCRAFELGEMAKGK
jgi:hypothetical protein